MKHSSTKFTPNEARTKGNEVNVKLNTLLNQKHNRKIIEKSDTSEKLYKNQKHSSKMIENSETSEKQQRIRNIMEKS